MTRSFQQLLSSVQGLWRQEANISEFPEWAKKENAVYSIHNPKLQKTLQLSELMIDYQWIDRFLELQSSGLGGELICQGFS